MHKAKGREFDAVAIVDLHDGKVPHFSIETTEEFDEARRLLYVSMTRARRILMWITDQEHWKNTPSPFLCELGLVQ
jgi:DNA helicase-2/ATP-dependent DNA helicase PcrA